MPRRVILLLLPVLLTGMAVPASGTAQEEATAVLEGQVLKGSTPLDSGTVTLHEVGPDSAGEIATRNLSGQGRFRFLLPSVPDPGRGHQVYFASIRFRDVLYFGPAIAEAAQLDSLYVIHVYDTVAAPTGGRRFPLAVRNVFLEPSGDAWRVTDLFQVRNDGDRTYVSAGGPVWVYPLPPGASDFTVGQSDLAPDAVTFEGHVLEVSAPIPPGERLYMVRYTLPTLDVSIPTPGPTDRMELLVREPAPPLVVEPLEVAEPVELEQGSAYRRYQGRSLTGGSVVLSVSSEPARIPFRWVAVVLALVLAVGGILAFRAGPRTLRPVPHGSEPEEEVGRRALLIEIARLDEAFSGKGDPGPDEAESYRRKREALKQRLKALDRER